MTITLRGFQSFWPKPSNSGMALVSVLIFAVVAMIVITAAVALTIATAQANWQLNQGQQALHVAEAGAENAMLRLLRNPGYTGETLTLPDGTATIAVTGTNPKIITVTGRSGTALRRIVVNVGEVNGVMSVQSWQEVF